MTTQDAMHHALGGDGLANSQMDLLNAKMLNNDILVYGYGYAMIKNYGLPGDTVNEAAMRRDGINRATNSASTYNDAENAYWVAQP